MFMPYNPWTPVVDYWLAVEKSAQACGTLSMVEQWTAGPKLMAMMLARSHREFHESDE